MFQLETPRLHLRELSTADAAFLIELLNDPSFIDNIGDKQVRTDADVQRYLETGPQASYRSHGYGLWRVALQDGDVPIGICGPVRRAGLAAPDIGFALLPAYTRQGYGFEAARACRDHVFSVLGFASLLGITDDANRASQALLEKLGLSQAGVVDLYPDEAPLRLYTLSRAQWLAAVNA